MSIFISHFLSSRVEILSTMRIFHIYIPIAIITSIAACCSTPSEQQTESEAALSQAEVAANPAGEYMYGIPIDSFEVERHMVKRGENLGVIMARNGVSPLITHNINEVALPKFDFRGIRSGNSYTLFFSPDTLRTLKYFIYDIDAQRYIRCKIATEPEIELVQREIHSEEHYAYATIETSLWTALTKQGLSPELALNLSEIYAWTIDFFGIEKGDKIGVIYTENFVDTTSIGIDKIVAAYMDSHGKRYYAFRYEQDSLVSYFDMEGNNLRRAFLKAPLSYTRISSRFSNGRMHPILKIRRAHHGVDYAAPSGTPVYTIGDGKIVAKGWDKKGGGNYIKIKHNSVYTSVYMHLRGFANGIAVGKTVSQGDLIGYVGKSGLATGPHLDFRIYMNGKPVDPLKVEAPPVEPINNDELERYIAYSDSLRSCLCK